MAVYYHNFHWLVSGLQISEFLCWSLKAQIFLTLPKQIIHGSSSVKSSNVGIVCLDETHPLDRHTSLPIWWWLGIMMRHGLSSRLGPLWYFSSYFYAVFVVIPMYQRYIKFLQMSAEHNFLPLYASEKQMSQSIIQLEATREVLVEFDLEDRILLFLDSLNHKKKVKMRQTCAISCHQNLGVGKDATKCTCPCSLLEGGLWNFLYSMGQLLWVTD
jgi:hypothetical protein